MARSRWACVRDMHSPLEPPDEDTVDTVVDTMVDELAQAGLVDLFILVDGGDDRRNNTDDFLAHK